MWKERAGRGKRDEHEQRVLGLQLPPRFDAHERVNRQQDHRGVQRERQREAEAARGGQRAQARSDRAAGESGERKGVALEKPQGERKQRADERLRQK